jgi:glycosyltransferase involved in cell wall biosynthesis
MVSQSNLHYVVYRYNHHSPHSGYSLTAKFGEEILGADVIRLSKPVSKVIVRDRIYWWLAKGTPGYTREAILAELKVVLSLLKERNSTYHFLYGESTYHYAGLLEHHRGNRLIATFHAPLVGLKKRVQIDWHLKKLSGVICLGTSQMDYLSKIVGANRVFKSSLGIDVNYYVPPETFRSRDPDLCVFVGENYRDFPTLRGVIELVCYKRPNTRFVGVVPEQSHALIGVHPNLELRSGIPEGELLDLYQSASLMVLPMCEAVANNSILEAMACGLPQIVTDVGDTREYVSHDCAVLTPKNDARRMADTVLELLDATKDLERMSIAAVLQAQEFAWPKVITQLDTIYSTLA